MKIAKIAAGLFCLAIFFSGCVQRAAQPEFVAADASARLKDYTQKVDNFLIIFDASSSMFENHAGQPKVSLAKATVANMNHTIPDLKLTAGLRTFGPSGGKAGAATELIYGMAPYEKENLDRAVKGITTNGHTPMSVPLAAGSGDLRNTTGDIALIVISDGLNNGPGLPEAEAERLKKEFGGRLCLYTIQVGDDPAGRAVLEKVAQTGQCGFAANADDLATSSAMADYVEKVFLKKAARVSEPAPEARLQEVATINLNVLFDFDKDNVKKIYHDRIKEAADFMTRFPDTVAVIEGHTDNWGGESYNINLSRRRAESVRQYLIKKFGISPTRLSAKGYGFAKPIATNATVEGRQKNRRVVAVISKPVRK